MKITRIREVEVSGQGYIWGCEMVLCEPPSTYRIMARRLFLLNYAELLISLGFNQWACEALALRCVQALH